MTNAVGYDCIRTMDWIQCMSYKNSNNEKITYKYLKFNILWHFPDSSQTILCFPLITRRIIDILLLFQIWFCEQDEKSTIWTSYCKTQLDRISYI